MFSDPEIMPPAGTTETTAVEAVTRAEIDIQIATAHRFPRALSRVRQEMMSFATADEETAQACFYSLPRGGKNIEGPSVRLAEIAVSTYGNLRVGTRIIATVTAGENPHVLVEAIAHDLERNTCVRVEKRRRILPKKDRAGGFKKIDEDDVNLAANNCSAVAFRDATFKVIPGALVKPVLDACKQVSRGNASTLGDRRAKAIDAFAKMGVRADRILARLEKRAVDDIDLTDLETLTGLRTAIRENEITLDEAFPPVAAPVAEKKADKPELKKPDQKPAAASVGDDLGDPLAPAKGGVA